MGIVALCDRAAIDCNLLVVEGEAAITRGRSNLAATFLRQHYQTFAMIDADILIEPEDFLRLLRLNKSVRGAAVCLKTKDHSESLNVYKDGRRLARSDMGSEPLEVDLLGGAVMLIEREVIEDLSKIDALRYTDPIIGEAAHIFGERIVDKTLLSEDFSFCHLAREHGFSVWIDPTVKVSHFGPCSWTH